MRLRGPNGAKDEFLLAATVLALAWANSPWQHGYEALWSTDVVGDVDLHTVVNDGLMSLFFFVVGLEIKREVVEGELADRRVAALPALAALGGMVVPAVVYLAVGWSALVELGPLLGALDGVETWLVVGGGLLYSVGAAVYALHRPNPWPRTFGYHEIFHALVVAAATVHYVAAVRLVGR